MNNLIKKLVEAWGPSGYEHHVRAMIRETMDRASTGQVSEGRTLEPPAKRTSDSR